MTQYAEAEPPSLPFAASTNSAVFIPLLLDAAGMLSAGARRAWHTHPTISEWWPTAVTTLLARPFLPVPELAHAVEHVSQAFQPSSLRLSPSLRRFREWAALRHGQVTSLAELLRAISDPWDGHHCKKHCSPCCWVPLPPPRWNAWLTAYDVPLPPQHVWPTQQALKPQVTRATTRLPALNRKQQPPLPRLGRRFSRHLQTRAQPSPRAVPGRR